MNPNHFGDSLDMAKRQIKEWLAANEQWYAHPMWYDLRPEPDWCPNFLERYASALNLRIVDETCNRGELVAEASACADYLLLDPDTGLNDMLYPTSKYVRLKEFVDIVAAPNRRKALTLVYDQSYQRNNIERIRRAICNKLQRMHGINQNIHIVGYAGMSVSFILASSNRDVVTMASQRMQRESHFPARRFVDDGCGHVGN